MRKLGDGEERERRRRRTQSFCASSSMRFFALSHLAIGIGRALRVACHFL